MVVVMVMRGDDIFSAGGYARGGDARGCWSC